MNHIVKENLYITNQISMDLAIILVLLSEAGQNIAVFGKVQIPSVMFRIHHMRVRRTLSLKIVFCD